MCGNSKVLWNVTKYSEYWIKGLFAVIMNFPQFFLMLEKFQANFVKNQEANSVFIYSENGAIFEIL